MYRQSALGLLARDSQARSEHGRYASRFGRWDELASVRRKPRRLPGDDCDLFFPPELHPVVMHPLVAVRGGDVVKALLVQRLYDYLHFTTELESLAVIPVAIEISRRRSGLSLPPGMQADAFKIVTDEAWHAQFCFDFACQLEACTGVPRGSVDDLPPAFAPRLKEVRDRLPCDLRGIEASVFAVVSETLISGILSQIPGDERMPPSVRSLVRDHAEDEGRHHVYFRAVLKHLWSAMTPRERGEVGPQIPAVIYAFLEPDYLRARHRLRGAGLTADEAGQAIEESWPREQVAADIAMAAAPVVRYFAEAGALEDGRTSAAFAQAGILLERAWPEPENTENTGS